MKQDMKRASEGYIFYNTLGDVGQTEYWQSVRDSAHSYFSKVKMLTAPSDNTAQYLYDMGKNELEKEKDLLEDYFGAKVNWNENNYDEIIKAFNQIINIERMCKKVRDNIYANNNKVKLSDVPNIYGDLLRKRLNQAIPFFFNGFDIKAHLKKGEINQLIYKYDIMINGAIDGALSDLFNRKELLKEQNNPTWKESIEIIDRIEKFRQEFNIEVFRNFGFDRMKDEVLTMIKNNVDLKDLKENILTQFKIKVSGGLNIDAIAEFVSSQLNSAFLNSSEIDGIKWKSNANGINTFGAENSLTIMGDGEVDFSKMIINDNIEVGKTVNDFYNSISKGLGKTTVIYESNTPFRKNSTFSGFSGGTRNLEDIEEILNHIGYNNANAFINKIKQTMPGAMYGNSIGFQEEASKALASAVAYLLFNDMQNIGVSNDNSVIHIFKLNNVVLPLSFLLIKVAEAMKDAESNIDNYINVNFELPSAIMYNEYPMSEAERSWEHSVARWSKQALSASDESKISINFLSNFKEIMSKYFN